MKDSTQASTIGKGTYHLFIGNLVSTVVLAVAAIIIGRLLGPDTYGLYTIALIVPSYIYLLLQWGLPSTITRYATKYLSEGNEKKAVSFSYTMSIVNLAAGLLVVGLLIPFSNVISTDILHRPELSAGIIILVALLSVVGQIMFYNGSAAFVGLHAFGKSAVFQVVNALAKLSVSVILVLVGYSVLGAVAGYAFGFIFAGAASFLFLVLMNKTLIPTNIREHIRTSIKYAPPIYFSNVILTAVIPFQNTILAYIVSNKEIGWYSAAVNIATLIALFTYPVSTALLPLFSKTMPGGTPELAQTFKLSVKYSALFITPVTMLLMALSTPLATAIYGPAYQFSGNFLIFVASVNLLSGIGHVSCGPLLNGVGETQKAFVAAAIGSMVSIVASVAFVFYAGVFGVIIGAVIGQTVSLFISLKFVSDILKTKLYMWSVWRIYLASGLSAALVYPVTLFNFNPFVTVTVCATSFTLIVIPIMAWTKAHTREDMNTLREQFKEVNFMSHLLDIIAKYHGIFATKKANDSG